MKTLRLFFLPLLVPFLFNSCASVKTGNDPVVVHAEQTIAIGTDAFDTFLLSEEQSHSALCSVSPATCREVHEYAEFLRTKVTEPDGTKIRRAKQWLNSAIRLTEAYKGSPTAENKTSLQKILNTITAAIAESQKYTTKIKAARGP